MAKIGSSVQKEDQVKNKEQRQRRDDRGPPIPKQSCGGREEIQRDAKRKEVEGSRVESRDSMSSVSRQARDDS